MTVRAPSRHLTPLDASTSGPVRTWLPALLVLAVMVACASESGPPAPGGEPVELSAVTERTAVEDLGGMDSWVFDVDVTNEGDSAFAGRYFVHGETPTGDVEHRGVFPLAARRALTDRVKRIDFGGTIGDDLLATGGVLELEPGETERIEGGIVLDPGLTLGYSDAVLYVYDTEGRMVYEQPVAP